MDVSKLKVQELKDELEKRGVATTKTMKKKELSDLLEETIVKEGSASAAAPPAEDALPVVEPTSTSTSSPPPSHLEDSSSQSAPTTATAKPSFPPVFNEDETPLAKTTEELAQIEREEKAGAGEGGVEGAQHVGIAVSVVEPEEGELPEVEMNGEEKTGGSTTKRALEKDESGVASEGEKLDEAPTKKPRLSTPLPTVPLSSYPPNFLPNSHPPTRALYITNLRRPLADPTLHDHLSSFGPLDTSSSSAIGKESCGWWLSPVKSHAFVVYQTLESAVEAYTSLQGCTTFPDDDGGAGKPALAVTFLPPAPIAGLIKQEVRAWTEEGRRKLELLVEKNESSGEWELSYKGVGDVNLAAGGAGRTYQQYQQAKGGYMGGAGAGFGAFQPNRPQMVTGGGAGSYVRPIALVSSGGNGPNSFTRPNPVASSSSSAYPSTSSFSPPSNAPTGPSSSSTSNLNNGFSRPRPPHESSSSSSSGPRGPSNSYERERERGERVTDSAPRLSWGERGVDRARGEMGGRGGYERDGGRRGEDERRREGGRDEREGGRDGGRAPWGERRR